MLSAFLVGIRWGMIGLIVGYLAASVPILYISQYFVNRLIDLKMVTFFRSLLPAFVCSACMAAVLGGIKYFGLNAIPVSHLVVLIILVPGGIAIYFALLSRFFPTEEIRDIYSTVTSSIKGKF